MTRYVYTHPKKKKNHIGHEKIAVRRKKKKTSIFGHHCDDDRRRETEEEEKCVLEKGTSAL